METKRTTKTSAIFNAFIIFIFYKLQTKNSFLKGILISMIFSIILPIQHSNLSYNLLLKRKEDS